MSRGTPLNEFGLRHGPPMVRIRSAFNEHVGCSVNPNGHVRTEEALTDVGVDHTLGRGNNGPGGG